jgi:hypothetical protein
MTCPLVACAGVVDLEGALSPRPVSAGRWPLRLSRPGSVLRAYALLMVVACVAMLAGCEVLPGQPVPPKVPAKPAVASPPVTAPDTAAVLPVPSALPGDLAARDPDPPAVAARFPVPRLAFDVPGLAPGRQTYTTDAELKALLRSLQSDGSAASAQAAVRLLTPGRSQLGAPIEALLFTQASDTSPAGLRADGRPTVLLIAQQHGNEPAGAEALLVLAQQLARGSLQPLLKQLNVIVLPRANPDATQQGLRAAGNGIDINRDHLLLRTPEAQAMARLMRDYRPMVVLDAHEYQAAGNWPARLGVRRRHDLLLQYAQTPNTADFVTRAAEEWFRQPLLAALSREQLSADWYHVLSGEGNDRTVSMGSLRPDNSRNVAGLRHAVSLLIESRGIGLGRQHIERRVHSQVVAATSVLNLAAQRAGDLQKLRRFVDSEVSAQACKGEVVIEAEGTPSEYNLTGLDPATGRDRVLSINWVSTLQLKPLRKRNRPCGYWLAADQTEAAQRLRLLGLTVMQLPERLMLRGEAYKVQAAALRNAPARAGASEDSGYAEPVPVDLQSGLIEAEAGSYYIPLTQPLALLAVAALEPDSPGSYLAHGLIERADALARITVLPVSRMSALP